MEEKREVRRIERSFRGEKEVEDRGISWRERKKPFMYFIQVGLGSQLHLHATRQLCGPLDEGI